MDKLTQAVKAFYEAYPYPSGIPLEGVDDEVRQQLSEVRSPQQLSGPLQVLEAGCGCGLGLIAAAKRQPDCRFTGVDINRAAIAQAGKLAKEHGLNC